MIDVSPHGKTNIRDTVLYTTNATMLGHLGLLPPHYVHSYCTCITPFVSCGSLPLYLISGLSCFECKLSLLSSAVLIEHPRKHRLDLGLDGSHSAESDFVLALSSCIDRVLLRVLYLPPYFVYVFPLYRRLSTRN